MPRSADQVNGTDSQRLRPRKPPDLGKYHARPEPDEDLDDLADLPEGQSSAVYAGKQAKDAQAWAALADPLATWTMKRMVNRTDTYGHYLPLDERSHGKALTRKETVTVGILARHYRGAKINDLIGLHTTSADNTSLWLGADIDHHGEPDKDAKRRNRKAAKKLYRRAKAIGFHPLLFDSNGKGGYHLLLLFRKPVETPKVHIFGKWLVRDWKELGLTSEPELFPKQPRLEGGKKYGNFLRLPGRHHTLDFYTKVWTGKKWVTGEKAINIILGTKGVSSTLIPAEVAGLISTSQSAGTELHPSIPAARMKQVQNRALALINTMKAVQGKGGDKATWQVALYLVKDFALSVEQALPLIKQWNATCCQPPWSEGELLRKLRLAEEEPGQRGRLLDGEGEPPASKTSAANDGTPYWVPVPDFLLADWLMVQPRASPRKRGRKSGIKDTLWMLGRAAVVSQRSSHVVIPDVLVGQVLWGGDREKWPRRWRREIGRSWKRRGNEHLVLHRPCPASCPLHGRGDVPHRHLNMKLGQPDQVIGCLHHFFVGKEESSGAYTYDFRGNKSHHPDPDKAKQAQEQIEQCKKSGQLYSIYLPAWLFGPRVLGAGPARILQAITRELTRTRSRSSRPDQAEVISERHPPILDKNRRYVAFNGNSTGKRRCFHGTGYKLGTWMERAGYAGSDQEPFWKEAKRFLADLKSLCDPLGLVVGGYIPEKREWQTLDRLRELVQSSAGRRWLKKCRIKVFGPEDYLAKWREYFAQKLDLSFIPGGDDNNEALVIKEANAGTFITSGLELDAWMRKNALTNRKLAKRLGVSATQVSYFRSESRPWSDAFSQKLIAYMEEVSKKSP